MAASHLPRVGWPPSSGRRWIGLCVRALRRSRRFSRSLASLRSGSCRCSTARATRSRWPRGSSCRHSPPWRPPSTPSVAAPDRSMLFREGLRRAASWGSSGFRPPWYTVFAPGFVIPQGGQHSLRSGGLTLEHISYDQPFGPRTEAILLYPAHTAGPLPEVVALHDHGAFKFFLGRRSWLR